MEGEVNLNKVLVERVYVPGDVYISPFFYSFYYLYVIVETETSLVKKNSVFKER